MTMKTSPTDEHDDERGRGAEHPDLVLRGEEEHPLSLRILEMEVDDDPGERG